jgi:uncharacterized SAM-dependent methyltransferase
MAGTGICDERRRLLDSYARATSELTFFGREVSNAAISYEADAFQRAWDHCESVRQRCAAIRHELTRHIQEHGCSLHLFSDKPAGEQG